MTITNLTASEFLDSYNFVVREGEASVSPSTVFTAPSAGTVNTTLTGGVIGTASPATATIVPPLTLTNIRPEIIVNMDPPPAHINGTVRRVGRRTLDEQIREHYSAQMRSIIDEPVRFRSEELSSEFFSGAHDSFRYLVGRDDRAFDLESIRPQGNRISGGNTSSTRVQSALPSSRISNGNDLIKFFKEKVELKLNGVKTDTTIELTLSLNLVDTGEEILSTQEVIELD
jgi:hypothetical protein